MSLHGSIVGDFGRLEALKVRLSDARAMTDTDRGRRAAEKVVEAIEKGNREALALGLDRHGRQMDPVRDPADPRRGGTGPPLTPRDSTSRAVAGFAVEPYRYSGQIVFRCGWSGDIARILGYHAGGRVRGTPVRDILGVREPERMRAREILATAMRAILRGRGEAD